MCESERDGGRDQDDRSMQRIQTIHSFSSHGLLNQSGFRQSSIRDYSTPSSLRHSAVIWGRKSFDL
jgi:hypothetical protein